MWTPPLASASISAKIRLAPATASASVRLLSFPSCLAERADAGQAPSSVFSPISLTGSLNPEPTA